MEKGLISKLVGAVLVLSLVFGGILMPNRGSELPQPEIMQIQTTYLA